MSKRAIWKYNSIAGAWVNSNTTTNANTFKYKWVSRPQYGSLELRLTNGRKHMWQVRQVDSAFRQIAKCDPDTVTKFSLKSRLQIHKTGLHYEHISIYLVPLTQSLCFLFLILDERLDQWWAESKQGDGQILTNFDHIFLRSHYICLNLGEHLDPWWAESKQGGGKISTKSGHDGALRQNIFTQGSQNWKYLHMEPKLVALRWNTYRQNACVAAKNCCQAQ